MPQVVKVDDRVWFRDIMAGDGFVVSDLIVSRWLGSWGIVTAVPLVDEQGLIQGSVALFIGLDWLAQRYQRGARSEDRAAFALLDSRGEIITRDASRSPAKSPLPRNSLIHEQLREQLPAGQTRTFRARGHDGIWRLYAVSPLLGGRIFVIRGTPVLTAIGPLALQVAWGVLTPLLMWALAIAVVWFGIEHLVVRWITYLERITSAYAAGRHNVRPERVAAAPAEIRSLGETFSRMADLISARESELRESLGAEGSAGARDPSSREEQPAAGNEPAESACAADSRSARGDWRSPKRAVASTRSRHCIDVCTNRRACRRST